MFVFEKLWPYKFYGTTVYLWVGRVKEIKANVCKNKIKYM